MTNNDTCVCIKLGQSGHHYMLKKTVTENDSGQWFFYLLGTLKPTKVWFNITMSHEHPPSGLTTEGTSFSYDVTESTDEADKELDEQSDGLIPSYLTCCQHPGGLRSSSPGRPLALNYRSGHPSTPR
ncbi:uncharacterized protein LOC112569120 [Pomacea canaliculata]|uniref:uncharacterized protein LOC112569120 n=1 Tax=Pomacea canaliculata TaxID=400727 RepID=UPI000D73ABA5|nr:uncharacterized protein LOC112569120 [Pomacea canaliculata]